MQAERSGAARGRAGVEVEEVAGGDGDQGVDKRPSATVALLYGSRLECRTCDAALTDDREQGPDGDLRVIGDRHGDRGLPGPKLHDHVAAALAYLCEPVLLENPADLAAG